MVNRKITQQRILGTVHVAHLIIMATNPSQKTIHKPDLASLMNIFDVLYFFIRQ